MVAVELDIEALLVAFFEEADEHLATFEQGLLTLESDPTNREVIGEIFRAAHSIKGTSGTFGLTDIIAFTHALETVLDRLRGGLLSFDGDLAKVLLASVDVLRALVDSARTKAPPPPQAKTLEAELEKFFESTAPVSSLSFSEDPLANERTVEISFAPKLEFMGRGMDPLAVLRELETLGQVISRTLDVSALPALEALDPEKMHLAFGLQLRTSATDEQLHEPIMFVEHLCTISIRTMASEGGDAPSVSVVEDHAPAPVAESAARAPTQKQTASSTQGGTIRVATEKVDELLDLVSELVISQSMVVEAARGSGEDAETRLSEALLAMERHTRELQERVMSIRMVPLATVFRRFPRLVHDLAATVGKRARLVVEGEATEIDKGMVEQLADPLTHLVRNAIDHGLEAPEDREKAGKSDEGTVTLRAFHQGGNVVIEVADDGRGLPTEKIRAKAERLELITPGAALTDEQLHDFIFHPGFSTAAKVTDISGRGVGMDVVKRNVEGLNGSLSLSSAPGAGTCLRLRLPLTLAILDGLAVRVGGQTFVVPLLSVVESFRPQRSQVRSLLGCSEVLDVRGASLPIARLHDLFGVPDAERDPTRGLICMVEANGNKVALLVDEVLGQGQFVVKSLEVNFRRVEALMGATILGDGRVAMIIDVQALSRMAGSTSASLTRNAAVQTTAVSEVR